MFVAVLGGLAIGGGVSVDALGWTLLGVALAAVGQIVAVVGVVAAGVRLGLRWHSYDSGR